MSLFKSPRDQGREVIGAADAPIPVAQVDLAKRYDIYCHHLAECRIYEDIRIVGIRTFDQVSKYGSSLIGGFLEIEAGDGSRMMIMSHGILLMCEHNTKPCYKIVRTPDSGHLESGETK